MPTIKTTSRMKVNGQTYYIMDDVARTEIAAITAADEVRDDRITDIRNAVNTPYGMHRDLKMFLYKDKCYMSVDGTTFTDNADMCVMKIPIATGDIVYLRDKNTSDSAWANVAGAYRAIAVNGTTYTSLYNTDSVIGKTADYEIIAIGRPGVNTLYIQLLRDKIGNVDFYFSHGNPGSLPDVVSEKDVIRRLTVENTIPVDSFWPAIVDNTITWRNMTRTANIPLAMYIPLKAGQKITANRVSSGFGTVGIFDSWDETSRALIGLDFTAPADGFACIYRMATDLNVVYEHPVTGIKINYSDIMDPPEGKQKLLEGVNVTAFGDSITARELYQPFVEEILGGTWSNCGINNTPLSGTSDNAFWKDVRINAVKAANPDLLIILGGANDLVQNPVIGDETDLTSKDTGTFIGAYSYIIDALKTWKPALEIVILSTTWAHNDGADVTETSVRYKDFAAACKTVAAYYHLPYVDLYGQSGFNTYTMNSSPYNIYSADHIHPNEAGGKIIASMVAAKIREVYSM